MSRWFIANELMGMFFIHEQRNLKVKRLKWRDCMEERNLRFLAVKLLRSSRSWLCLILCLMLCWRKKFSLIARNEMKTSNFNTLYGHRLQIFSQIKVSMLVAFRNCVTRKSLSSPKISLGVRSGKMQQKRRQIRMEGGVRRGMSTHLRGLFDI